eukprot:CAMPEP_0118916564 /NCGR_PEP_ID=MMETSP1166-20130328/16536_1 /TAXON_ID=1104430 /ORGANISM="Chrysoreinhardia sp, Strain CCMP3193" /LENGTH=192 /DNA_ID=CAMNT_0006856445 /DNA_START=234 /DNA_END=810 /DNA_ORIENTATION=-
MYDESQGLRVDAVFSLTSKEYLREHRKAFPSRSTFRNPSSLIACDPGTHPPSGSAHSSTTGNNVAASVRNSSGHVSSSTRLRTISSRTASLDVCPANSTRVSQSPEEEDETALTSSNNTALVIMPKGFWASEFVEFKSEECGFFFLGGNCFWTVTATATEVVSLNTPATAGVFLLQGARGHWGALLFWGHIL